MRRKRWKDAGVESGGDEVFAGLDVGSDKICAVIGREVPDEECEILGIGTSPATGMDRNSIVDLGELMASIRRAMKEAESLAEVETRTVYLGVAEQGIRGICRRGITTTSRDGRPVEERDVARVVDVAKVVATRSGEDTLQIIPQEFFLDGQEGIRNPLGMVGSRLEAEVYIVVGGDSASLRNLEESVSESGLTVEVLVLESLAASEAVLGKGEKELGVVVVDIGRESVNLAVFAGTLRHTRVLADGGGRITQDIVASFAVGPAEGEELKRCYGQALASQVDREKKIPLGQGGSRETVSQVALARVIEHRLREMFEGILREVRGTGIPWPVTAGVVLTGGGSLLTGIEELGRQVLGVPVRVGKPRLDIRKWQGVAQNPLYSTAVGLVKCGVAERRFQRMMGARRGGVLRQAKKWLDDFF